MALNDKRLCVFCGKVPNTKTREHVVPYWLLEATGDPKRVVNFGQNYAKGKEIIKYSWSNFVAPACDDCNNKFASLEARIKPVVETLMRCEALTVADYVELLDWLDKVRIGAWLVRHMIENHPIEITPNFHISARMGQKDRMVAVYVFDSDNQGINLLGSDSLIFNSMPSCYGLRINNILLLNASSDFFCSKGCGLPYPKSMTYLADGPDAGRLALNDFGYEKEISDPITELKLFKPVVWLYQPIKQPTDDPAFQGGYLGHSNLFDSRIAERTLGGAGRFGALFRQYADHIEMLGNPDTPIDFDTVTGADSVTQSEIAASVYDLQVSLFSSVPYKGQPSEFDMAYRQAKLDDAEAHAAKYRERSPDQNDGHADQALAES
ncbi:HNH endonuclease [Bosea sp. TAF32]|uniref:HNH endonuclease n=1 Tax=Bosea sp. TAF32 TaxID=3237482 RepID=UPI003F8F84F0